MASLGVEGGSREAFGDRTTTGQRASNRSVTSSDTFFVLLPRIWTARFAQSFVGLMTQSHPMLSRELIITAAYHQQLWLANPYLRQRMSAATLQREA